MWSRPTAPDDDPRGAQAPRSHRPVDRRSSSTASGSRPRRRAAPTPSGGAGSSYEDAEPRSGRSPTTTPEDVRGLHRAASGACSRGDTPPCAWPSRRRYLADHMAEVPVLVIPCVLDRLAPDAGPAEVGQLLRGDPPCRVELPAGVAQPRARVGVDDVAPRVRTRGRRGPRHPRDGHPGGPAPGRRTTGRGLPARPGARSRRSPTSTAGRRPGSDRGGTEARNFG